jgi:taurine dioxygenase
MTNYQHIKVQPLTGCLGAEVSNVDLSAPLDRETFAEIKHAWLEHLVLFFRDQALVPEAHKRFGEYFGELKNEGMLFGRATKGVDPYILTPETGKSPYAPRTEVLHIDHSYADIPNMATILQANVIPDSGGDTLWVNCYAAFESLSEPMQKFVEGLTGYFPPMDRDRVHKTVIMGPDAMPPLKTMIKKTGAAEHPLVHIHPETGKKALFVDFLRMWSIKELSQEESRALINFLEAHCAQPELQCRFHWQEGSLAIWDNRCTLHKLVNDKLSGRRVMQTVRVEDSQRPKR